MDKKYSDTDCLLFANSYYSLLSTRQVLRGKRPISERYPVSIEDLERVKRNVEEYAASIPRSTGNLWIERPENIKEDCLEEIAKLEARRTASYKKSK